jgi:hypothetical protein
VLEGLDNNPPLRGESKHPRSFVPIKDNGPITIERLERALFALAYFMELDGPIYTTMYEKVEAELALMRQRGGVADRAKLLLESYKSRGGMKAIC